MSKIYIYKGKVITADSSDGNFFKYERSTKYEKDYNERVRKVKEKFKSSNLPKSFELKINRYSEDFEIHITFTKGDKTYLTLVDEYDFYELMKHKNELIEISKLSSFVLRQFFKPKY